MKLQKPTIYLIPRWAGNIHSDWYDWMTENIRKKYGIEIRRLEMPDWNQPDIDKSLVYLENEISELNESIYFIGHSVGCQAVLRFLHRKAQIDSNIKIGGFLFVAGWFQVDKPWVTLQPWLSYNEIDLSNLSQRIIYKKTILSDNDPFTSDTERNKALWKSQLNSEVKVYRNKLHFNESKDPEVLAEIEEMIHHYLRQNE